MIINHNMASLNTYRQLSINNANSSKSLEKLSSGLRINRAGDDAAGLAISEKMRGQIRGLDQATRNSQDAISMINTAEGSLSETHNILQRMKELATQAANDTNVNADRTEIQKEINQLTSEINRIGNTTEFNTQKLLNGGGAKVTNASMNTTIAGALKGAVSVVSTNVESVTGRAKTTVAAVGGTTGDLTIEAAEAGTDLNGIEFKFVQNATESISKSGNVVTVNANFAIGGKGETLTALENYINNSGLVTDPIKLSVSGTYTATEANTKFDSPGVTTAAMAGGGTEVRGNYSFDITSAFATVGDTVTFNIDGTDYTLEAVNNGGSASGSNIAFEIKDADGNFLSAEAQATKIAAALNSATDIGSSGSRFENGIAAIGNRVVMVEAAGKATGTAPTRGTVDADARQGSYSFEITADTMVKDGGKYSIDGIDIRVTTDNTDAGLAKGEAILVGANANDQAANLKQALALNTLLNVKYDASGSSGLTIQLAQVQGRESASAPVVTTSDSSKGSFEAKFQIGANTAQSMTIEINDMRSAALKISGTTAGDTITASNGSKATLKVTKEVTNGTDNTSVEYALDVSSHDKATAAISVLDDAIQTVSAERSKLGAYTNRLEHTITNLGTSSENLTAAESRIRDVDMAKEMMNFQKNNILSQAAQAMLAQANQQPQGVLQLLR